jgi:small subunit ribosomal protein S21
VAAGLRLLLKAAHQPFRNQLARGQSGLSEVIIQEDENFERALKRFKKKVEKAGILADLRKHRHYEKPSEKRKRKMNAATRKNRRHRAM